MPLREQNELFFYEELYHDLKTPLSILFAYIQLLERMTSMPAQAVRYVQEAKKSCFRMAKLVRDANDGARLSKGMLLPQFVNTDIVSLVTNICDNAKVLTEAKHIRLHCQSRIPEKRMAVDKHILERILLNLLSNAKQYSPLNGEIIVTVDESASDVLISVRDYGPGVSEDMSRRIFLRGESGDNRHGHSGLGLYIVSELAALLGGEAYLTGAQPGMEVAVRLPAFLSGDGSNEAPVDDFYYDNMVQMELSF